MAGATRPPPRTPSRAAGLFAGRTPRGNVRLPRAVRVVEVGPRDGLQNEAVAVSSREKIRLVEELVEAGVRCIEVTAFVSPRWVPQLGDAGVVMRGVRLVDGVRYTCLVPNVRGFEEARAAGAREVAVFASATESFSRKNVNVGVEECLARCRRVCERARVEGVRVRGYVSCVVGCPYEGEVKRERVAEVAARLYGMGCYEISLGDTIGVGNPKSIVEMIAAVVKAGVPVERLAIHCHDTRGTALANVLAAMSAGVSVVDSSIAGLGGCPFAPGAAGNLATEDLVHMLQGMGIDVGPIDLARLVDVGNRFCASIKRKTSSKVARAMACQAAKAGEDKLSA